MTGTVGIDPGARHTGLAYVRGGRVVDTRRLRGADGTAGDWALLARVARLLAVQASAFVREHQPDLVAIETMEDQSGRKAYSNRHTTAACCQALYDVAVADGWAQLVVWQRARDVLDGRHGYGQLVALLRAGTAGSMGPAGKLDEHRASAAAHAHWAEAMRRRQG